MRLFIAINLSEQIKDKLYRLFEVNSSALVRKDKLHITVVFLGEIKPAMLNDITNVLDRINASAFYLETGDVGSFHDCLYVGIKHNDTLTNINNKLIEGLNGINIKTEARAFVPHITIIRKNIARVFPETGGIRFRVNSIELMQSLGGNYVKLYSKRLYSK